MSDYLLISFPLESQQAARRLARSLVGDGLALSAEISGPLERIGSHLGAYAEQVVWKLTCRTTTDHLSDLEAFALRTINRRGIEFNIVPILPGESERPTDS